MATGNIRVNIGANISGLQAGIKQATYLLAAFNRQTLSSARHMGTLTTAARGFGDTLYRVTATISLMRGAIQNVYSVTGQWAAGILKTNAYFEKSTYLMKGFSQAADSTVRWKEAEENVKWIREFSKTTPFSLDAVMDAAVRLKSVGFDPMTGSLRAMTDAVAASGKGQVELERAMLALQQIVGKGKLSMEEIRQQMAEAVPRAMEIWARSMNMSIADFTKAVSDGMVSSVGAVQRFMQELNLTFGGAGQNLMQSFEGRVRVLSTTWQEFQLKIGEFKNQDGESFFGQAKKSLLELTNLLQSSDFTKFAQEIGLALTAVTKGSVEVVRWLLSVKENAIIAGGALLTAFAGRSFITLIMGINTGLATLTTNLMLTGIGFQGLGVQARVAAGHVTFTSTVLNMAGVAARGAAVAMGILRVAIMSLSVIGGIITLVWGLVTAINALRGARASLSAEVGRSRGFADGEKEQSEAQIKTLNGEIVTAQNRLKRLEDAQKRQGDKNKGTIYYTNYAAEIQKTQQYIAGKQQELNNTIVTHSKALEISNREVVQADASHIVASAQENLATTRTAHDVQMKALSERLATAKTVQEKEAIARQMDAQRAQSSVGTIKSYNEQIEKLQSQRDQALKEGRARDADAYSEATKQLQNQKNIEQQMLDHQVASVANVMIPPSGGGGGGSGGRKKRGGGGGGGGAAGPSPGERKFQTMDIREHAARAGLLAELEGRSPTAARIIEQYEQGMYDDSGGKRPSRERLEEIIKVAEETDKLREAVERKHEIDNAAKSAEKEIANQYKENTFLLGEYEKILKDVGVVRDKELLSFDQNQAKEMEAIRAKGDLAETVASQEAQHTTRLAFIRQLSAARTVDLYDSTKELARSLMDETNAMREAADEDIRRQETLLHLNELTSEQRAEAEKFLATFKKLRLERLARDTETPIEKQFRDWSKYQLNLEEAGARWIDNMSSGLTEFVTTGKMNFKDFANSVINDITRIGIQASLSKVFDIISKSGFNFSGLFGGSATSTESSAAPYGLGTYTPTRTGHTGGMVRELATRTTVNQSVFEQARRYHKGHFNLKPNEVPAILTNDESVLTPGQLRALGGRNQTPNVQINVVNQTSQPVSAESGNPRLELDKWILDVVLKNAARPGSFRDGIKGALSL